MIQSIAAPLLAGLLAVSGDAAWSAGNAQAPNKIYNRDCSVCHQNNGAGVPGAFPRLAGRVTALAALAPGRKVLIATVLYGMAGKLEIDGHTIIGVMPGFPNFKDAEVAEILNFLASLNGSLKRKFTAKEVAAIRSLAPLTPTQVNTMARDSVLEAAQK